MTADEPARNEPAPNVPPIGSTGMWTWIAALMVLFMGLVIVMAVIQTHAQ
jgi:hypothetical protein